MNVGQQGSLSQHHHMVFTHLLHRITRTPLEALVSHLPIDQHLPRNNTSADSSSQNIEQSGFPGSRDTIGATRNQDSPSLGGEYLLLTP